MKLLIYGDIGGSGGYIRYCKGLLGSNSIPDDVDIWFITSMPLYKELAPLDAGINIITHPWLASSKRLLRYFWYLWAYPRIVNKIKPDAEFFPSGHLRVYLRKAITIATCHNLLLFDPAELMLIEDKTEQQFFKQYRNTQIRSLKRSKAIIYLSNHSKSIISKELNVAHQNTVIPHGLDSQFLLHDKRSYIFKSQIKLLYISPFFYYKHQMEVIKAVQFLKQVSGHDISLKLIGGGSTSAATEINAYVDNEHLRDFISIIEKLQYEDLLNEYRSADIFIFASSCETFGITLLEAMGSRLPIACSDRSGLNEILKDAGVYFNPEIPESISEAIQRLISDIKLREHLGEKAYSYALKYTWERCTTETINYIRQIVKRYEK